MNSVFTKKMKPGFTRRVVPFFASLRLGMLVLILSLAGSVSAQSRMVTGTVVDEAGNPVIGASVVVDGTSVGVITGSTGAFTISSPNNGVLKISFMGYLTETVTNLDNPRVVLKEDVMNLEEVVVVGYGTQSLKNVTGAVATINPTEVKDLPVMNLGAALRGQVPGLDIKNGDRRPNEQAEIKLRQEGGEPLIVIDDFVYSLENKAGGMAAFNNLDPNMIESITILKDASAAVYGANAAQGAIIVKTKRGTQGAPKISYSGSIAITDAVDRPDLMSAYDYGIWRNRMAVAHKDVTYNSLTDLYQADELEAMKNMNYDWLDNAWSSSYLTRHNVNISGGSQNATYFAGVSYSMQDGNLFTEFQNRWNYNAGVTATVAKNLKVSLRVSGDYGESENTLSRVGSEAIDNDYNTLLLTPRHMPWSLTDETGKEHFMARPRFDNGMDNLSGYNYYAIEDLGNKYEKENNNMMVSADINYDFGWSRILRGLNLRVSYSRSMNNEYANQYGTYYNVTALRYRGGSGGHLYMDDPDSPGLAAFNGKLMHADNMYTQRVKNADHILRDLSRAKSYQANFYVTYARSFGKHNVSGLFTIEKSERDYLMNRIRVEQVIPGFTGVPDGGALGAPNVAGSQRSEAGMLSYVGRVNYSYADKYLFEFLIRSDASTKFAPENYWGTFPSFSAGWVMSEENWFKGGVSWVDFLKIRFSFGVTGSDKTNAWQWTQKFKYQNDKGPVWGTATGNRQYAMETSAAPNRDAHWDHVYKHNLGIDARFLRGRLSVTLDAYYDRRRDQLASRGGDLPQTVGANMANENFANDDYWGGELSIGWRDRVGEVNYYVRANTSYVGLGRAITRSWSATYGVNAIKPDGRINLDEWGYDALRILKDEADVAAYIQEYSITSYFGKKPSEIRPGMVAYRDVRGQRVANTPDQWDEKPDGVIDDFDQIKLAKFKRISGFNLNFGGDWRGITLSAQINASWGGYNQIVNATKKLGGANDLVNQPIYWNDMFQFEDIKDAQGNIVAPKNLDAKYPSPVLAEFDRKSSIWHVPSFRMYLRSLTIGYTIPQSFVSKLNLSSIRVSLTGNNLLSFYNPLPKKFMNPMMSYSGYPTLRTFSLGLNIGF